MDFGRKSRTTKILVIHFFVQSDRHKKNQLHQQLAGRANLGRGKHHLRFARRQYARSKALLQHQRRIEISRLERTMFTDREAARLGDAIKTQAILRGLDFGQ